MSFLLSNVSGFFLSAVTILSVLRIVGLVILIILIVVIALAVCVLFLPARYRAKGDIDQLSIEARFQWLFKIIMFRASYKDGVVDYALYLFGIRTKLLDKDAMERRKRRRERRKGKKAARKHKSRKRKYQKKHDKYKEQFLKENQMDDQTDISGSHSNISESDHSNSQKVDDDFHTKSSDSEQTSMSKMITFVKKAVHIMKTILEYRPVQLLWPDIQKLLYRARPRKIRADIQFGLDDPALTGQILGAISNLYFIYAYDQLFINGDFETDKSYIEGNFDLKGHIQGIYVLIFVIRVFKKKQFKKFMDALKL